MITKLCHCNFHQFYNELERICGRKRSFDNEISLKISQAKGCQGTCHSLTGRIHLFMTRELYDPLLIRLRFRENTSHRFFSRPTQKCAFFCLQSKNCGSKVWKNNNVFIFPWKKNWRGTYIFLFTYQKYCGSNSVEKQQRIYIPMEKKLARNEKCYSSHRARCIITEDTYLLELIVA